MLNHYLIIYNKHVYDTTGASRYCLLWVFLFEIPLKIFKTRLLGRCFHTLVKNASFSFLTDLGSHNLLLSGSSVLASTPPWVHPLRGLASSLAHRPMSGFDTICNSSSPPLTDIVLFRLTLSNFPSKFLKHVC